MCLGVLIEQNMKEKTVLLALCLAAWWMGGFAQSNIIDEVIWIVGDEAIFRSEVEEQRLRAQYEGVSFEGDPYCIIPEQIAIQKLFLLIPVKNRYLRNTGHSSGKLAGQVFFNGHLLLQ